MEKVLGIDVGGTNLRIGIVSKDESVNNFEKISSKFLSEKNGLDIFVNIIQDYLDRNNNSKEISAIAIGVPSVVSKDKSFIYSTPNLKGIENINLGQILSKKFNTTVKIDRDVNYLLLNDIKSNNLDPNNDETIIGVYLGTGLGNAIYIDGHIFVGANGAAGELGHIPLYGVDDECTCGKKGCAETRISGRYLEELSEKNFPDTRINKIFLEKGDDPIIKKFVSDIAIPIAAEINLIDPHYVILAGGVLGMEGFPREILLSEIKKHLRMISTNSIEFIFPKFSQMNGVVGGALSIFKNQ